MSKQENYMEYAIKEANKAYLKGEIPVGAIILSENKIYHQNSVQI